MKKLVEQDPLAERPNLDFSKGVRGKYNNAFAQGTNIVILDPALVEQFPTSEAVNTALRAFLALSPDQRDDALQSTGQTDVSRAEKDIFDKAS